MKTQEINLSKHLSIHSLFKSISGNFISLFIPLIVLKELGYQLSILYVIILSLAEILTLLIFNKIITKKPILSICIHFIFSICAYISIVVFQINVYTTVINAIFAGIGQSLYYTPIFSIISANKSKSGFSSLKVFSFIGTIVMIIFNGYILNINETFSVWLTCAISFVIYILSVIPFLIIKNKIKIDTVEIVPIKQIVQQTKSFSFFHISFGLQDLIVGVIIPLYLYINNLSFQTISYVLAIINIIKIIMVIFADKLYKNKKGFVSILIGCILFVIPCLILPNITDNIIVYILTILISISFPLFFIPNCNLYSLKTEGFSYKAMFLRNIFVHGFRPIILLPFLFTTELSYLIYLGPILALVMLISAHYMFRKGSVKE